MILVDRLVWWQLEEQFIRGENNRLVMLHLGVKEGVSGKRLRAFIDNAMMRVFDGFSDAFEKGFLSMIFNPFHRVICIDYGVN